MAVIQFYESRVSFDKPKATRPNGTNNNENGKMDQDEITTNLALQLLQQQKLQQQIISQLLHSRPPIKTKTTNNNEKTSAASGTKVIPCTGCNVLLQYHVNARQIQCPRCKTTMMLDNSNTV